ncbi:MAG: hypothetical protein OZ920_09290 [Burkholderiales bacterium]|nr:hypothetical protein [Burkholderiales bacterium]
MFDACGGGGAAIVPPGPGNGRDSMRLDGIGVVSIATGASAAVGWPGGGVAAAGGGGGVGAGVAAGRIVGARCTIGAG